MDSAPVGKENATGNVAAPSNSKPAFKAPSQDGPKARVPLRALAAKPQEHVAVRAVSAANKRMLDRQATASATLGAHQGEPSRPTKSTRMFCFCFSYPCGQISPRAGRHFLSTSRKWTTFVTPMQGPIPCTQTKFSTHRRHLS